MLYKPSITKIEGASGSVFRRDHIKADGRVLSIYGYEPHKGDALNELVRPETKSGEIRRDPLRGTWAIYAPHRQTRTFQPSAADDPLAAARDGAAPTEIPFENFELAVFENRFPSLFPSASHELVGSHGSAPARGHCDVVVYTSESTGSLATVSQERRILLIEALIDRYNTLHEQGYAYVMPFENRGDQVGVTLPHPHGQIYAFDNVPAPQAAAAAAFERGYNLVADVQSWREEFEVTSCGDLSAFCPPFARFPYETWITPLKPCQGPWALDSEDISSLAHLLGEVPKRLDRLFGEPMPYMMSFQAAPGGDASRYQFTVQFLPLLRASNRTKFLASVEQFTGVFTVDVVPEYAAQKLREVL